MRLLRFFPVLLAVTQGARADYFDDTGYRALAAELGAALPDGTGVGVTQVEFGDPAYLPQGGTGNFTGAGLLFAGKTFTAKSGTSLLSGHAEAVGAHFFSLNTNPAAGRATFTPGISLIDVYRMDGAASSTSWTGGAFLKPGPSTAPLVESRAVQNHSWISSGSSDTATGDNDALRRFDFAIRRDGFLAVTGVNNGPSNVPALMASAYNNLSVGLSSGNHSTGGVAAWLDGPLRQKPELVAPLDFTSFSTALVSSAGALLRQAAYAQGADAVQPDTLKAILLAGATKEEFPGWTRTRTAPLDPVFGAGELHVGNSWHILAGLQQDANLPTARPASAWSRVTPTTDTTADYRLSIPPGMTGGVFSATAVWNRVITNSAPGSSFAMSVEPPANYQLSLDRLPVHGNPVVVDESLSAIENVEHLYQRNLPSGTYRLRLSPASGGNVPAAVAWRMSLVSHRPEIDLERSGNIVTLLFSGLIPGQAYLIQSSPDLAVWEPVQAFTATGETFSRTVAPPSARMFYRLAATD